MAELLLIVRIAGERVALRAADVECVVELEGVTPVPRAAPHVAGLTALRSRVLTVIDACVALGLPPRATGEAVVVPSDGHSYAIAVDAVEDVVEEAGSARALALPVAAGWARAAPATVEAGGALLLLVDPHALIAGRCAEAAA